MTDYNQRCGRPGHDQLVQKAARIYYAEVAPESLEAQSESVERLIERAFGDLGAQHLEVRVLNERTSNNTCAW